MDLFGDLPEPEKQSGKDGDIELHKSDSVKGVDKGKFDLSSKSDVSTNLKGVPLTTPKTAEKRKSQDENSSQDIPEKILKETGDGQLPYMFSLKGYAADRQGEREDMQDAHVIINDMTKEISDLHSSIHRLALFAVFDGHGGVRASRFASQHLHNNLRDKFPKGEVTQVEKEIKKAFIEAFKKTDEDFLKEATKQKPSWKDGTTAVLVLAINDTLYIANLGDSKAVLCRKKEGVDVGIPLTVDHSPSLYEERMRIQKAGGYVKDGRVMGQLEVARSIGDGPYKNHGVTCVPNVKRCQLTENDRYLMIACDGLWKSFTIDDSIQFTNKVLQDQSIEATKGRSEMDMKFDAACSRLANSAVLRLSGDNVTVVLVAIGPNHSLSP